MKIIQVDLDQRRQVRDFLDLPFRLYRDVPQWVPPLQGDERLRLDRRRYPYYRHSAAAFFLAYQDRLAVGRLAALDNRRHNEYNHAKTAFFYMFECENDPAAARPVRGGLRLGPGSRPGPDGRSEWLHGPGWARPAGQRLRAPSGFWAALNPPHYAALVEAQGFEKMNEVVSGALDPKHELPPRIHALAQRIQERRGLRIARFHTRRELHRAVSQLEELYNGALHGTEGGTPIDKAEVKTLADQMLWFADPSLIKIVMKDERPVGFLLAYPDVSAALQRTKGRLFPFGWLTLLRELHTTDWININGMGLLEEYRGLGGTAILYSEMFKSVNENPRYRHAEVVQIGLENERMQREMENFGVDFYKLHRTYRRQL